MKNVLAAAILLGVLGVREAAADDWTDCIVLSFAPLEVNLPACDRTLADGGLAPADRARAHAARAEALGFALTYHGEQSVDPEALLSEALADLDAAVALDRFYRAQRGDLRMTLGDPVGACADYTAMMRTDPASASEYLERRSLAFERLDDIPSAIEDMTAAIRLRLNRPDVQRYRMRRAALHEQIGDLDAAARDYRAVLQRDADYPAARLLLDAIAQ